MAEEANLIDQLQAGIRASSLRSSVIANNIANASTPDYRRSEVRFHEVLDRALESGGEVKPEDLEPKVVTPESTPVDRIGNDVVMEKEVAAMVKNGNTFKAYTRLLSSIYSKMELAMRTSSQ